MIKVGLQQTLDLGNLDAKRDWGYAPEYVEAMWRMLQQDCPGDYDIATGQTHSVREFANAAFRYAGMDWNNHVNVNSRFIRPAEVDVLCGNPAKAKTAFGWEPKTSFNQLVEIMTRADIDAVR